MCRSQLHISRVTAQQFSTLCAPLLQAWQVSEIQLLGTRTADSSNKSHVGFGRFT